MIRYAWLVICLLALMLEACAAPTPGATTGPVYTPMPQVTASPAVQSTPQATTPTSGSALTSADLKVRILAQYPDFFYCDPDFYPVARANEADLAVERFATIQADRDTFAVIVRALKLDGVSAFTAEQKLAVYRFFKRMNAIALQPDRGGFSFTVRVGGAGARDGMAVIGTISAQGVIAETQRQPTILTCPICLARGTPIDTPDGPVAVQDMRPGMRVWTVDARGARVSAAVVRAEHVAAPPSHTVVRVRLADGRTLTASPGHPTTDGRVLGDLRAGDLLDGAPVERIESMPYEDDATYDILPDGPTGAYWAGGILVGSTLK